MWSDLPNNHNKSKDSWKDDCRPKEEGGLGIRRLCDSSRVYALKLIWKLFPTRSSLWVSCVHYYLIRSHSFLGYERSGGFDMWHLLGRLVDIAGDSGPRIFGIPKYVRVADLADSFCWLIRPRRGSHLREIYDQLREIQPPSLVAGLDTQLWCHKDDDFKPMLSSKHTWEQV